MKKSSLILLLILALSLTAIAAADAREYLGDRIVVMGGDEVQTYPANTPFHIYHGWWIFTFVGMGDPYYQLVAPGRDVFTLALDGEPVHFSFIDYQVFKVPYGDEIVRVNAPIWVFNFGVGLEGTHTFTGTYYWPCKYVDGAVCDNPNALVVLDQQTITVNFVP